MSNGIEATQQDDEDEETITLRAKEFGSKKKCMKVSLRPAVNLKSLQSSSFVGRTQWTLQRPFIPL